MLCLQRFHLTTNSQSIHLQKNFSVYGTQLVTVAKYRSPYFLQWAGNAWGDYVFCPQATTSSFWLGAALAHLTQCAVKFCYYLLFAITWMSLESTLI